MESNDNLDLEGQISIIEGVEKAYEASDRWKTLVGRFGEYSVLHHPYCDIASLAGDILNSTLIPSVPADFQETVENRKKIVPIIVPMILDAGGTLTLDSEFEINALRILTDSYEPKSDLVKISKATWEQRVIEYVKGVIPVLAKAISLEDTPENEDAIGYVRNDLLDHVAFLQAYLIAKTQGLDALKNHAPALQEGKLVYQPN